MTIALVDKGDDLMNEGTDMDQLATNTAGNESAVTSATNRPQRRKKQ